MADRSWLVLALFVGLCLGVGGLGATWTSSSVRTWYPTLNKPAMNPPKWMFAPVWTTLYFLMAVSAWMVWRQAGWNMARGALALFGVQLFLNLMWSWLFFGLRRPGMAFAEILFLLASIAATAVAFLRFSRAAFWMMVPYGAWVCFASFLNLEIWRLNPS